jgi:hypothetical protein
MSVGNVWVDPRINVIFQDRTFGRSTVVLDSASSRTGNIGSRLGILTTVSTIRAGTCGGWTDISNGSLKQLWNGKSATEKR